MDELLLITLLSLTWLSKVQLEDPIISTHRENIFNLLYGDLGNFSDMHISEADITKLMNYGNDTYEPLLSEPKVKWNTESDHLLPAEPGASDVMEYNQITLDLLNFTRRQEAHDKYYDYYHYPFDLTHYDDPKDQNWMDWQKKDRLIAICLQFLIHTRYKVYAALKQRESYRSDKRYKLGYLFNRLRRLRYDQNKLVSVAHNQDVNRYMVDVSSLLRLYQQILRIDIDIRDTIEHVKAVSRDRDPFDVAMHKLNNINNQR